MLISILNILVVPNIMVTPYISFLTQESFLKTFYTLKSVDETFETLNLHFSCKYPTRLTLAAEIFSLPSILITEFANEYTQDIPFKVQFPRTIGYYGGFFVRCQPIYYYLMIAILLSVRLHYLKEKIKKWAFHNEKELIKKLTSAAAVYQKICAVARCANKTFAFSLLSCTLITMTSSLLLVAAIREDEKRLAEFSFWFVANCLTNWLILIVCQIATTKSKETVLAIANLEIPENMPGATLMRSNVLLQILHESIEFNIAGLFNLDVKLILSHINTMSTIIMFLLTNRFLLVGR